MCFAGKIQGLFAGVKGNISFKRRVGDALYSPGSGFRGKHSIY
jgi:hypothetical protein